MTHSGPSSVTAIAAGIRLDVVAVEPVRERAGRALLDHRDHLRPHRRLAGVGDLPHMFATRVPQNPGVHADRAVVAHRDAGAAELVGALVVGAGGGVVGDEPLAGVGAVAERLAVRPPQRHSAYRSAVPTCARRLPGERLTVLAVHRPAAVQRHTPDTSNGPFGAAVTAGVVWSLMVRM